MSGLVLVLNAGSSSIKFALYEPGREPLRTCRGEVERIGIAPQLRVLAPDGAVLIESSRPTGPDDNALAIADILAAAERLASGRGLLAAGHRVVHGGTVHADPVRVTAAVLAELDGLVPLAPLHQPHNLAPIRMLADRLPDLPQVACFDTAFHRAQPPLAQAFALPARFTEAGVRRYGFHGLSYEFIADRLARVAPRAAAGRVIVAHLGAGASLCAMRDGRSVASTMGFTALDGLMMGTRCGALDPGVILHLLDRFAMDVAAVEDLLYRRSGLLGVSGISADMRTLRASSDPRARVAIDLFVYRIVREIGSLAAALGGLDALVFTAGIGEHDAATRAEVAAGCAWLGVRLDPSRNAAGAERLSGDGDAVSVWCLPTDEEGMIARHTLRVLGAESAQVVG